MASEEITKRETVSVLLKFGLSADSDCELIPYIPSSYIKQNTESDIFLFPIISYLKNIGYNLESSLIWYYSQTSSSNIYCGTDPIRQFIVIPWYEIEDNTVTLIFREAIRNEWGTVLTAHQNLNHISNFKETPMINIGSKSRRLKERKIGCVIEKVSKWRQIYDSKKKEKKIKDNKIDLEEAANEVGISKKSLDDYLSQIRFGKKFGFNFHVHRNDMIGVLRAYVKKFKKLEVFSSQINLDNDLPLEVVKMLIEPGTPVCKHNRCCAPTFALKFKNIDS